MQPYDAYRLYYLCVVTPPKVKHHSVEAAALLGDGSYIFKLIRFYRALHCLLTVNRCSYNRLWNKLHSTKPKSTNSKDIPSGQDLISHTKEVFSTSDIDLVWVSFLAGVQAQCLTEKHMDEENMKVDQPMTWNDKFKRKCLKCFSGCICSTPWRSI